MYSPSHGDDEGLDGRECVLRRLLRESIDDDQATTHAWVLWSELAGAAVFDESLREPLTRATGRGSIRSPR